MTLRGLAFGLATLTGLAQRGWFIPARHADAAVEPARPWLEALFSAQEPAFRAVLQAVADVAASLEAIGADDPAPAPRWSQDWFPRLDAAVLYALVATRRPRRIVEIGSGHSTRFIVRALQDHQVPCEHIAIDPAPRAAIDGLPVRFVRQTLQGAGSRVFAGLGMGDILVVDSSHVLMPGSDVDHLFTAVLPALPPGVLIHVHDIFLPEPYPAAWTWRGYNEQQALAPLLGNGFRPLFSSRWAVTRMAAELARTPIAHLPLVDGAFETSLWLERC
ncbi:class I SAM-dependent methyltransferase [Zavarzinia sp. CC-PAN008]|uniref:class I SAM-dependent methyltransferase n=1 Tax=Zavarzinia sp. CC-PAN008 TaxID=3243332 RepID=UPI003F7488D6